jgi:hypothetical protein
VNYFRSNRGAEPQHRGDKIEGDGMGNKEEELMDPSEQDVELDDKEL